MYLTNDEPLVHLDSSMGFFDIFTIRSLKRSDIKIPNTMLCEEGEWKEWMFNSEKERTHVILRKHQENLLTIKVVRFFCHVLGCYEAVKQCLTVEEVYEKLQGDLRNTINTQAKVIIIYKSNRQPKLIRIIDLIKTLMNRSYAISRCPDGWVVVQETIQFSHRNEEYYYVSAEKSSEVTNYRFSFLKRIVPEDEDTRIDQENIFNLSERKDVTRTLDQGLTHRQLSATLKLIDFIETNLRLSVRRIDLKMGINKSREPYLLAVLKLTIRIPEKFIASGNIKPGSTINIQEYLALYEKLKNLPESEKKRKLVKEEVSNEAEPCSGDFCSVALKGEADKRIQSSTQGTEVSYDQIKKVRANIALVLAKLKDMNLIVSAEEYFRKKEEADSDEDQLSRSRMGFLRKVCKKCFFLYGIISKTIDFDAQGKFLEKPNNFLSRNALTMISEGIALPNKMSAKIISKPIKPRQEGSVTVQSKNFLKLNVQSIKNNLPLIPAKTRPLSASIRKDQQNKSSKRLVPQSDRKMQTTRQDPKQLKHRSQGKSHSQSVVNIKPTRPKISPPQFLPTVSKGAKPRAINKKVTDYTLQAAKNTLMTSLGCISATSVNELKEKYNQVYHGFRSHQDFQVQPVEYLFGHCRFPLNRQHIYSFENSTPLHDQSIKYHITDRPTISLQKLSELSGCPEIIMKNNFIVDTLICDEKTTIIFCVLTSEMFGNEANQKTYENIIIVQDMFDCFLEYLQLAKDLLESSVNKRIILFNYPGQSYTLYNENRVYDGLYACEILDKLIYRLSEQLHLIDAEHDDMKFAGIGYGGYIVQMYTSINHTHYPNLKKILLVNTFTQLSKSHEKILLKLVDLYRMKDKMLEEHAHLYYNVAINSNQQSGDQIDNKVALNPISVKGRSFILNNIIESTYPVQTAFEEVAVPTLLVYGKDNCLIPRHEMHVLAHYFNNPTQRILTRQLVEVAHTGHALMDDNPLEYLRYFEQFIQS